ncbi:hypothetical protein VTO73DRAFT_10861 [Trametes versicolor]
MRDRNDTRRVTVRYTGSAPQRYLRSCAGTTEGQDILTAIWLPLATTIDREAKDSPRRISEPVLGSDPLIKPQIRAGTLKRADEILREISHTTVPPGMEARISASTVCEHPRSLDRQIISIARLREPFIYRLHCCIAWREHADGQDQQPYFGTF